MNVHYLQPYSLLVNHLKKSKVVNPKTTPNKGFKAVHYFHYLKRPKLWVP